MRKFLVFTFIASALVFGVAGKCKKNPTPPPGGGGEPSLVVILNPPVNSTQPAAPQVDFPLTVTILSTMPAQGVTIDVSAKKDDGSGAAPFFTTTLISTGAVNNFTITNTPLSVICQTTVTVRSRSTATNTWTGSYRYSRKP